MHVWIHLLHPLMSTIRRHMPYEILVCYQFLYTRAFDGNNVMGKSVSQFPSAICCFPYQFTIFVLQPKLREFTKIAHAESIFCFLVCCFFSFLVCIMLFGLAQIDAIVSVWHFSCEWYWLKLEMGSNWKVCPYLQPQPLQRTQCLTRWLSELPRNNTHSFMLLTAMRTCSERTVCVIVCVKVFEISTKGVQHT